MDGTPYSLLLDRDAWHVLTRLLPGAHLPAAFDTGWSGRDDDRQVTRARAAALARLRARDLVTADGDVVPALAGALAAFAHQALRARVRSWEAETVVLADLAIGPQAGVGLARLQGVTQEAGGPAAVDRDSGLVELSVFPASGAVRALLRALPPAVVGRSSAPVGRRPEPGVVLPWVEALAVTDVLARAGGARTPSGRSGRLDPALLGAVLADAGLLRVPKLLRDLSTHLTGAIEITLVPDPGDGAPWTLDPSRPTWFGVWLIAANRLIEVGVGAAPPDEHGDVNPKLRLTPAGSGSLSTEVLSAVSAAMTVQNGYWHGPPAAEGHHG
jgi:hypothetical protein